MLRRQDYATRAEMCFWTVRSTQGTRLLEDNAGFSINGPIMLLIWNSLAVVYTAFCFWQNWTANAKPADERDPYELNFNVEEAPVRLGGFVMLVLVSIIPIFMVFAFGDRGIQVRGTEARRGTHSLPLHPPCRRADRSAPYRRGGAWPSCPCTWSTWSL